MKKILVLMGGESEEREVSLRSGQAVLQALKVKGYTAIPLDFTRDSLHKVMEIKPDAVFIALHGKKGEDGTVQGFLDLLGIPYTGSGVAASAICMNKILCKKIFAYEQIPTPDFFVLGREFLTEEKDDMDLLIDTIGLPMVIKAAGQGSSIGTYIVSDRTAAIEAIKNAREFDNEILAEKFIAGTEITVSILGNEKTQVLPLIEITSVNEFYDYQSKYTPGMCAHIIPARVDAAASDEIARIASRAYKALNCRGFARVDLMIDGEGNPYVLEINTVPGMTEMSLVPDAARAAGMDFAQLVDHIVKLALENK